MARLPYPPSSLDQDGRDAGFADKGVERSHVFFEENPELSELGVCGGRELSEEFGGLVGRAGVRGGDNPGQSGQLIVEKEGIIEGILAAFRFGLDKDTLDCGQILFDFFRGFFDFAALFVVFRPDQDGIDLIPRAPQLFDPPPIALASVKAKSGSCDLSIFR